MHSITYLPCPSITFRSLKVAPSPFPDRCIQMPTNVLLFPVAYGSAVETESMLPARKTKRNNLTLMYKTKDMKT